MNPLETSNLHKATTNAQSLAMAKIATKSQQDLFYLTKYILGYDLMTEATHGELCQLTEALKPPTNSATITR